jgi:hypothetical protein
MRKHAIDSTEADLLLSNFHGRDKPPLLATCSTEVSSAVKPPGSEGGENMSKRFKPSDRVRFVPERKGSNMDRTVVPEPDDIPDYADKAEYYVQFDEFNRNRPIGVGRRTSSRSSR